MPVLALDHINIRSSDPAAAIAFFRDALGMKIGAPPGMTPSDRGGWILDSSGAAIIHLGGVDADTPRRRDMAAGAATGTGSIDHIALRCENYEDTKRHLLALGRQLHENYVPQINLRQIFVKAPGDILFELNFPES